MKWFLAINSLAYPILSYPDCDNLAKGEITKFNFVESCKNQTEIGKRIVGSENGFDCIWVHLGFDYFKLISKTPERTC